MSENGEVLRLDLRVISLVSLKVWLVKAKGGLTQNLCLLDVETFIQHLVRIPQIPTGSTTRSM